MKVWVTSDTHFSHKNIIQYAERPFENIEEMNKKLINNWNSCIADDDIVIFCGDFCFCRPAAAKEITSTWSLLLNGRKIIVKGNHDFKKLRYTECGFAAEYYQLFPFGRFLFCHRPDQLGEWHRDYDFVFYGHTHQNYPTDTYLNCINVCLDANNLMPLDITDYFTEQEREELSRLVGQNNVNYKWEDISIWRLK